MEDGTRKKILIIDDEEKFCKMVKKNLEAAGPYEVAIENKGANAVARAREERPDLILLDVLIPDKRGPEVACELKEQPRLNTIPIVFLTATVQKGQTESFAGIVGGHPFTIKPAISKPVSTKDLVKCIEDNLVSPENAEDGKS